MSEKRRRVAVLVACAFGEGPTTHIYTDGHVETINQGNAVKVYFTPQTDPAEIARVMWAKTQAARGNKA